MASAIETLYCQIYSIDRIQVPAVVSAETINCLSIINTMGHGTA